MGVVRFDTPTIEGVMSVADNMRQADVVEVWASGRMTPFDALQKSIIASKFSTMVWVDNTPCAVFGLVVRDMLSGAGVPWMLGADSVLDHKRDILKHSRIGVDQMLDVCPNLYNYVHTENTVSIRWLRWLGFEIDETKPHGIGGELFHRFHYERVV